MQTTNQLAAIVGLLGQLWLYEVTAARLRAMQSEDFCRPFEELGGVVPETVDAELVESLSIQYCELLVGPKGHLSPVQSVWAENQFQSNTAASMNRYFELIPGYQPESNLSDHLGVQLGFLAAIYRQPERDVADQIAIRFASEHLQWALDFVDQVELRARSSFYQGLARVTRNLVQTVSIGDSGQGSAIETD